MKLDPRVAHILQFLSAQNKMGAADALEHAIMKLLDDEPSYDDIMAANYLLSIRQQQGLDQYDCGRQTGQLVGFIDVCVRG